MSQFFPMQVFKPTELPVPAGIKTPSPPLPPGLYLVATPIGNLGDITLRALDTLKRASLILAEDTRVTRILLQHFEIKTPMLSYHKFNEASRVGEVVARIQSGQALALVTDSGTPAISDPGARVTTACREADLYTTIIPGACAVPSALALSGLGGRGFIFGGFLPHKSGARRRQMAAWKEVEEPVVLYESPYRLIKLLDEIEAELGPRQTFVARELTKKFEETTGGTPAEIKAHYANRVVKGELVVIIAPAAKVQRPAALRCRPGPRPGGCSPAGGSHADTFATREEGRA